MRRVSACQAQAKSKMSNIGSADGPWHIRGSGRCLERLSTEPCIVVVPSREKVTLDFCHELSRQGGRADHISDETLQIRLALLWASIHKKWLKRE